MLDAVVAFDVVLMYRNVLVQEELDAQKPLHGVGVYDSTMITNNVAHITDVRRCTAAVHALRQLCCVCVLNSYRTYAAYCGEWVRRLPTSHHRHQ